MHRRGPQIVFASDAKDPAFFPVALLEHVCQVLGCQPRQRPGKDPHLCAVVDLIRLCEFCDHVRNQRREHLRQHDRRIARLERRDGQRRAVAPPQGLQPRHPKQRLRAHGSGREELPAGLCAWHAQLDTTLFRQAVTMSLRALCGQFRAGFRLGSTPERTDPREQPIERQRHVQNGCWHCLRHLRPASKARPTRPTDSLVPQRRQQTRADRRRENRTPPAPCVRLRVPHRTMSRSRPSRHCASDGKNTRPARRAQRRSRSRPCWDLPGRAPRGPTSRRPRWCRNRLTGPPPPE